MISAVSALDKVVPRFWRDATDAEIIGLDEASATIVDKLAVHDKGDAYGLAPGH